MTVALLACAVLPQQAQAQAEKALGTTAYKAKDFETALKVCESMLRPNAIPLSRTASMTRFTGQRRGACLPPRAVALSSQPLPGRAF